MIITRSEPRAKIATKLQKNFYPCKFSSPSLPFLFGNHTFFAKFAVSQSAYGIEYRPQADILSLLTR